MPWGCSGQVLLESERPVLALKSFRHARLRFAAAGAQDQARELDGLIARLDKSPSSRSGTEKSTGPDGGKR